MLVPVLVSVWAVGGLAGGAGEASSTGTVRELERRCAFFLRREESAGNGDNTGAAASNACDTLLYTGGGGSGTKRREQEGDGEAEPHDDPERAGEAHCTLAQGDSREEADNEHDGERERGRIATAMLIPGPRLGSGTTRKQTR